MNTAANASRPNVDIIYYYFFFFFTIETKLDIVNIMFSVLIPGLLYSPSGHSIDEFDMKMLKVKSCDVTLIYKYNIQIVLFYHKQMNMNSSAVL